MTAFWKFFLDNRAFTYFLVVLTLGAGWYAINSIPKESTPEITIPIAVVSTPFFGASASDVETLVTNKLEDRVKNLSEVKTYTSTSQAGMSSIVIEFEQSADIDERVTRLKEQVDQVRGSLPSDGNDPIVTKVEFSSQPIFTVSLVSDLPFYAFKQVVDELESELLDIDGIAQVTYSGIPEREISVIVDNRRLEQVGIDFNTVSRQLGGSNITLPGGSIDINNVEYPLDIRAEVSTFEELKLIPIAQSGESSLVISDIAELYNGFRKRETVTQVGFPGGETFNAATVNISKKNGGDITQLTSDIQAKLASLEATTLEGVETVVTYDAGKDIQQNLSDLTKSGAQTVALVFIILLLFVGFRESIIAAVSIPLSFMLAFIAFMVVGNTINFISLFSLILSIGILVDSAIVVVEGINAKVQMGETRQDAAVSTIREFGIPLFAGTMTTIAVFFPMLFLSGIIGQFISGIPYTVIFVLVASLFVSLGFITVFCAGFLKNKDHINKTSWANTQFHKLEKTYRGIIVKLLHQVVMRRIFLVGITLFSLASIMLVGTGLIKVEFFPGGDIEYAYIRIEMDPGAPLSDTRAFTEQVEEVLDDKEYIESFVSTTGRTSQFEEEVITGDQYANITLNIKREFQSEGVSLVDELMRELEKPEFEFAELVAAGGGPPTGSAIDVSFASDDTELLRSAVREAEDALRAIPGPQNISSSLAGNNSGFDIIVDRNAAYRFGVQITDIANVIRGATDGVELFDITEEGDDVPVFIRNRLNFTSEETIITKDITPDMLKSLTVRNNRGESILLGSIVSINLAEADVEVGHRDGERVVSLTADIAEGFNNVEVRAEFEQQLQGIIPAGVTYGFGGEQSEQDDSFTELAIALLAGVFLMFAILILQFGRLRQVLIILSVLIYAFAGVLIGLFISNNALSFPSILGMIALFGIVVNNSIILVSVFNSLRVAHPEWSIDEVVTEGSVARLRPILLTTLTTIIGVSPLLTASAIWAPIAYSIMFGLTFCVLVTLLLVPLLYRRFEGFSDGPWREFWSWVVNLLALLLVPILVFGGIVFMGLSSGGQAQFVLYIGLVVSVVVAYIATHIRRHK